MTDIDVLAAATDWLTLHPGDGGWIAEPSPSPTMYGVWAAFGVRADGLPVTDMPPLFVNTTDGTVLPLGTLPPGFVYDTDRDPWDRLVVPEETTMPKSTTAAVEGETATEMPWFGVLAPEGVRTGDGREMAEGSLRWRDLPLPLRWQEEDDIGHDGAVVVGRIDAIERKGNLLHATGVWDTGDKAQEARRLNVAQMLRGVSVDLDDATVEFVDAETGEPIEGDDMLDAMFDPDAEPPVQRVTDGRISAATICPIPAFQEAFVADGIEGAEETAALTGDPAPKMAGTMEDGTPCSCDEEEDDFDPDCTCEDEEVVASASMAAPWYLVASATSPVYAVGDFTDPGFKPGDGRLVTLANGREGVPFTVLEDGRVFGHLATWGTCHIGFDGVCVEPPHSLAGYAYFTTGSVSTEVGEVPVGTLTLGTGHAAARLGHRPAVAHYDDTGTAVADVAVGDDKYGIWFAGRLRPYATDEQVTALKHGGAVSGDWRKIGGNLELVAALAVNTPGFPVPRLMVASAGAEQVSLVASAIPRRAEAALVDDVTRQVLARLDRRARAAATARKMRSFKVSLLASGIHGKDV